MALKETLTLFFFSVHTTAEYTAFHFTFRLALGYSSQASFKFTLKKNFFLDGERLASEENKTVSPNPLATNHTNQEASNHTLKQAKMKIPAWTTTHRGKEHVQTAQSTPHGGIIPRLSTPLSSCPATQLTATGAR